MNVELKEQYKVIEILLKNNIELRPDENEENNNKNRKYSNEEVFLDADTSDELTINKNIKQSNEILCSLMQEGNRQAMQDLCIKNEGLVKDCAKKYAKLYGNTLNFDDIKQAGFIGLLKAAERFEISKGYAFSTYATWWIRQAIMREIFDRGFTVRVPVHMMENIMKVQQYENFLSLQTLEHKEKLKIIAEKMDASVDFVKYCIEIRNKYLNCKSLNEYINENTDTELQETVIDTKNPTVEDLVMEKDLKSTIYKLLLTLTPREARVLTLRFGLEDGERRTLEEVGNEFNVTRERIRQIEEKALRKLRHPSRSKKLNIYV